MTEPPAGARGAATQEMSAARLSPLPSALSWCRDWGGLLAVAMAICTAALLAWLWFWNASEDTVTLVTDIFFLPLLPVAALLAWRAAGRPAMDRRSRRAWRTVAAGFVLWGLGDILWFYYEIVLESEAFPSLADAAYLAGYPVVMAGLLIFPSAPARGTDRWKFLLDAGIVLAAAGMAIWHFGIQPVAASGPFGLTVALSTAYPVGDAVLMFGVVTLLFRRPPQVPRGPLAVLEAALVATILADIWFAYQSVQDTYVTGGWPDKLFATADVLLIFAAQYQYWTAGRDGGVEEPQAFRRGASYTLLPYVAMAFGYALLLVVVAGDDLSSPPGTLVVAGMALTGLVVLRQLVSMRENDRLLEEMTTLAGDLRRSEARFRSLVQNAPDVIVVTDENMRIVYESPAVERVLGYGPDQRVGRVGLSQVHPDDLPAVRELLAGVLAQPGGSATFVCRGLHVSGDWRWLEVSVRNLLHDPDVRGLVCNYSDITERRALEQQLAHQAFHDSLTNMANRALFKDRVAHALARAQRVGEPVSILFMDLDDFKTVNDGLGHSAGDELLVAVAERLETCIREMDTAARLGGDEFAILLEDADISQARAIADRVLRSFRKTFSVRGREVVTAASIGIAVHERGAEGPDELLRNADVAMYTAKGRGKGRYEVFDAGMYVATVTRLEQKAGLQQAVENDALVLHYQPIVSLGDGEIIGVEALLRYEHPRRGLVPPLDFVPLAEETGLIVPIGRWVLRKACLQMREWQRRYPHQPPLGVSVNLSPRQLEDPGLPDDVAAALKESGLAPGDLLLEITESTLLQDTEAVIARLARLKSLGVRLAIDDFGTGYSSLGYLHRFPVDILKIDRSFVAQVQDGSEKTALARTIIDLAHSLGLKTIAEGVEQISQVERLRDLGCDLGQGYLFARPLDRESLDALLGTAAIEDGMRIEV